MPVAQENADHSTLRRLTSDRRGCSDAGVAGVTRSPKEQIVLVAERLIADHGVDGVSLRQISAAAGNGNNSAVHYHFGSKDKLIRAIFEYRLPRLRERRALLIVERRPSDLRGWLECQIRAVLEQSEDDNSNYMSFVTSLYQHGSAAFKNQPKRFIDAQREFEAHLLEHLTHIDEPLRTHRFFQAMALIVHAAADRERARARRRAILPFAVELGNLLDGMVGFLEAPASPTSQAALVDTDSGAFHLTLLV
jgi:AcrR family transcriptional regulator